METISENSYDSTVSSSHHDNIVLVQKPLKPSTTSNRTSSMSTSILLGVAKTLKPHEWLLGVGAIISMYLVNGSFAASVCALATSIPAVIHSYRVITEEKDNLLAHQVTLCYWILL
uniref:Uncharacterized protein n=1 Tax=Panagrolaimus sp. ES5 TaxID=591445 RepID=A0AC34G9D7_9BILA